MKILLSLMGRDQLESFDQNAVKIFGTKQQCSLVECMSVEHCTAVKTLPPSKVLNLKKQPTKNFKKYTCAAANDNIWQKINGELKKKSIPISSGQKKIPRYSTLRLHEVFSVVLSDFVVFFCNKN